MRTVSKSLLLIEDNEDDAFLFKVAIKRLGGGCVLRMARDGREAMELLREYVASGLVGSRLQLVLLDLKMPYVGGLEVLEWIRSVPELRFLPVVVFSSSEQESDIEAAYRLGATSFLVKPSQPEQLAELVRIMDLYWFGYNRVPQAPVDRRSHRVLETSAAIR